MKALVYYKKMYEIVVPESWDELSARQFIKIAELLHKRIEDETIALDKALHILSNKSLFMYLRIPLDIRQRAQEHAKWVFEDQLVTKQLIPLYGGLYGPESSFDNLQLAEFHHSEMAYHQFIFEKNEDFLTELCAVLYRQKRENYDAKRNSEGDVRIPFSFNDIEFHKRKIKSWPLAVKHAILIWYDGCRQQLVKDYPTAFNSDDLAVHDKNFFEGLFGMIRSLSGPRYGTFKEVEHMGIHNAFMEIEASIEEEKELKKQLRAV
jgi:hypothetical protein